MMAEPKPDTDATANPGIPWLSTLLLCLMVLVVAGGILFLIFSTEPTAQREGASRQSAMLVDTLEVRRGTFRPELVVLGRVEPARDIVLRPRVGGEVISIGPALEPGGIAQGGEILVELDPSDFETAISRAESRLRQAEAALRVEMGRQNVARQDYALLDEALTPENEALVLREPQLNAARADVEAARANVEQAKRDLERTRIRAPFDAQILRREVNVGSQVSVGDPLGRLTGLETYWVIATVPLRQLRMVQFPDEKSGLRGSSATVRNRTAWPEGKIREGRVTRLIGSLDAETRLARVLIAVEDPLALQPSNRGRPRLLIGSILETRIEGREMENVVKLDRDYLREENTVWLKEDGKLVIREVEVAFLDATHAYISAGLTDGEAVVTTQLSRVAEGAELQRTEDLPAPEEEGGSR